jgi:hypothetical protein
MASSSRLGCWGRYMHSKWLASPCYQTVNFLINKLLNKFEQFRWIHDDDWVCYGDFIYQKGPEAISALYNYVEPFNAECRAFGRLQEAGCEELAVRCFGYVLLDEEHERAMMTQFNFDKWFFNGTMEDSGETEDNEQRLCYPGKNGRPPPFRCIVKAFGKGINELEGDVVRQGLARRLLRSIIKLQKLGIIDIDFAIRQVIDDKLGDFSSAITLPHFITNPELNPHLSPAMIQAIKRETFARCTNDYITFDSVIHEWNDDYGRDRGRLSVEAFPGGQGCLGKAQYNLRGGRAAERTLYTLTDPRRYRWTVNRVIGGANALPASQRRHAGRISKAVARRSACSGDSKHLLRKLTARPDLWHYQCKEEDKNWADLVGSNMPGIPHSLEWDYKDGYLFPVKENGKAIK